MTSRFNPSEETALAFCVHEIGRVMRLERHTPRESAGRLPTLTADVLRLVVPRGTLLWLGLIEREDGETVLTALKAALTYAAGVTEAERLIAEAAARGREWAINRRRRKPQGAKAKARSFEALPPSTVPNSASVSTTGTGSSTAATRPSSGRGRPRASLARGLCRNRSDSGRQVALSGCPRRADVAAEILVADGFAIGNDAGNPLWLTGPESLCGEGAWLRLAESDMLVANARRAADAAGSPSP